MNQERKKILIIEDEPFIRESLSLRLSKEGYDVHEAEDGSQGYDKVFSIKPDVVLLDIVMPVMDGLAAMEKIRTENVYGNGVPIIVMTNLPPDDNVMEKMTKYKPNFYFMKSKIDMRYLVEKIKTFI